MYRILPLLLLLHGCAGAPVGWGGTHKVVAANAASVTIKYDPTFGGLNEALEAAQAHCSGHGKNAVATENWKEWDTKIQVFECR